MAKNLQIYDFSVAANGSFQLPVEGSYVRIISCIGNVNVIGDTFGKLGPINKGQGLQNTPYHRLTIQDTSGSANSGTVLVSDEDFIDQTLYGSISLSGQNGAMTQAQATVTNASTALLASNANRRYLLIQNNDPGGDIYVTLDGTTATTTKGIKIAAGAAYESANYCPTAAINAIGSVASNANIVVVEG